MILNMAKIKYIKKLLIPDTIEALIIF